MRFTTDADVNGTSLQGYIRCKYSTLVKVFGEPSDGDGYKVDAEWAVQFEDGTIATIYNWKDGVNYLGEDEGMPVQFITDWHIGGNDGNAIHCVETAIQNHPLNNL